jgi:hypothetical protein
VALQQDPDGLSSYSWYQLAFDRFFRQQAHRPARPSLLPQEVAHLVPNEIVRNVGGEARYYRANKISMADFSWRDESSAIVADHIDRLSFLYRKAIFANRAVESVNWLADGRLAIYWKIGVAHSETVFSVRLPDKAVVAIEIHKTLDSVYGSVLMNTDNELVKWLWRVEGSCSKGDCGLSPEHSRRLRDMVCSSARYPDGESLQEFAKYFEGWSQLKGLTSDLHTPETKISRDMFFLKFQD